MKILICTEVFSPYRVSWFDELGKYAEVKILCLKESNNERDKSWFKKQPKNCDFSFMKSVLIPKMGKLSFDLIKEVKKNYYNIIVLDGYGYLTQIFNIYFLNKHKINYYVNIDGIVPNVKYSGLKFKLKKKILSKIPNIICGSKSTNKILSSFGVDYKKIYNHPFTSLYKKDIFDKISSKTEKELIRKKLNIKEEKVIISVGRFYYLNGYGKGYDVLIKSAINLPKNIGWYIVGGEPTLEFKKLVEDNNLYNVHFIDFKQKDELKEYYRASDLFVLMTIGDVWGLVINEAMACGLPIITTDMCVAGLELVKNNENGYIVKVGDDKDLSNKIKGIIFDEEKLSDMGNKSLDKIKDYTIENMADIHLSVFNNQIKDNK